VDKKFLSLFLMVDRVVQTDTLLYVCLTCWYLAVCLMLLSFFFSVGVMGVMIVTKHSPRTLHYMQLHLYSHQIVLRLLAKRENHQDHKRTILRFYLTH